MKPWARRALVLPGLLAWLVAAADVLDFSADERARIASHGPWPPAPAVDESNRLIGRPLAIAYGRALFFDRGLSSGGQLSCASCHRPELAFQDGLATARGRGQGLRNTPSLMDAAQQRWFGWDGAHDSAWAASLAPLLDLREMDRSPAALADWLRGDPRRLARHRAALGALPADDETLAVDLAKALAAYQATLVSPRTPFDDFRDALLRGDLRAAARYPLEAQRGLRLFIGEGRCALCHSGPAFRNGEFADIGRPFFVAGGVDPGRHGGLRKLLSSGTNRLGRYNDAGVRDAAATPTRHVRVEHRHFGEFKVPGLRQLTHTAPYMHDGSLATLEDVVRHYSELDEERLHADGERILRPLRLDAGQTADLLAFLRSLSSSRLPR